MADLPSFDDVRVAAERIAPYAHRTPVMHSAAVDERAGCQVFLKCENLQRVGAFKFRGATNAVFSLSDEQAQRGVATHSSGNHGAALASAARERGIPSYVVMPTNAPRIKRAAVEGYGATVVGCEPTLQAREEGLAKVVEETGATFVHPFNDSRVIAGQGTACLELVEQVDMLDTVVVPVGGGGFISGTAITAAAQPVPLRVLGSEPSAADDAYRSFRAGKLIPSENPVTLADGLKTSLGPLTFRAITQHVEDIVLVSGEES